MVKLLDRVSQVEKEFASLEEQLSAAASASDSKGLRELSQKRAALESVLAAARRYREISKELADVEEMLSLETDPELKNMAQEEKAELDTEFAAADRLFRSALLPPDPHDTRDILLEIRAGTGGEEAALFATDLFKMYTHYAERHGFRTELISANRTGIGGYKEVILSIAGDRVYARFKFEAGVHRVQRVPATEASGRIHTSAATVAVLPEPDEIEVKIDMNELRIDVYRSQGPGGQSVNTTDSAVRITHVPTGLIVTCQDEKSQLKNKNKALRVLRARLLEQEEEKQRSARESARRSMVGSGDRSERIRTYNFPQGRVTDHRIELTLYALDAILNGDLDRVVGPLTLADQDERLAASAKEAVAS